MDQESEGTTANSGSLDDGTHRGLADAQGAGFRLWFGVLGGAIAWLLHLLLAYGIAEFGCVSPFSETRLMGLSGVAWLEIGASLITAAVAAIAAVVAYRSHPSTWDQKRFEGGDHAEASAADSPRVFMAYTGVLTSALFVFIILVESLPVLYYLRDC